MKCYFSFLNATMADHKAISPIDKDFQRRGRFIESLHEDLFVQPQQIIRLFLVVARNSNIQGIYAPTLRSLRRARRAQLQPLMENENCRQLFMEILRHPRGIAAVVNA